MTTAKHRSLLALAAIVWTVLLWQFREPGLFNIDEIHYYLAAQRWADAGSFVIPNGFEQYHNNLMLFMHPVAVGALPNQPELTSFIPPLYIFPAALFFKVGGITGLFLVQSVCYAISLWLFANLGGRVTAGDERWNHKGAWTALVVFIGGTFFAEYGMAVINHMMSLALVLAAISCHPVLRNSESTPRGEMLTALAAGMLCGIATGVRLANIVTAGVLGVACLLAARNPARIATVFLLGLLPPLAIVGWINHLRFDSWNPFTYGVSGQSRLIPGLGILSESPAILIGVLAVAATGAVTGFHLSRKRWASMSPESRQSAALRLASIGTIVLLAALVLLPGIHERFSARVLGFGILTGDTERWQGPAPAFAFHVGERTALLATIPLLFPIILCPFLLRGRILQPLPWVLAAVFWGNVCFVCLMRNNGGFFLNQRYLIESACAGLLLVLAALWRHKDVLLSRRGIVAGAVIGLLHLCAMFFFATPGILPLLPKLPLPDLLTDRILPLVYGTVLLVAIVASRLSTSLRRTLASAAFATCCFVPICNNLFTDVVFSHQYRAAREQAALQLIPLIPDGSLVFVNQGEREVLGRLKGEKDVWIADAYRGTWHEVDELMRLNAEKGWRQSVFSTVGVLDMDPEGKQALLSKYLWQPIPEASLKLCRVTPRAAAAK